MHNKPNLIQHIYRLDAQTDFLYSLLITSSALQMCLYMWYRPVLCQGVSMMAL